MKKRLGLYRVLHRRMKHATADAALWREKYQSTKLVLDFVIQKHGITDEIPLYKRIAMQRKELAALNALLDRMMNWRCGDVMILGNRRCVCTRPKMHELDGYAHADGEVRWEARGI